MPEAIARNLIEGDFKYQFRFERLPHARRAAIPAAGPTGRAPIERYLGMQWSQLLEQRALLANGKARRKPDVVEPARAIVEPEQQRADTRRARSCDIRRPRSRRYGSPLP